MKNEIDISIIIVSYNTRELLRACLGSFFNQAKGKNWEIIVVDNASSDGTSDLVREKFHILFDTSQPAKSPKKFIKKTT